MMGEKKQNWSAALYGVKHGVELAEGLSGIAGVKVVEKEVGVRSAFPSPPSPGTLRVRYNEKTKEVVLILGAEALIASFSVKFSSSLSLSSFLNQLQKEIKGLGIILEKEVPKEEPKIQEEPKTQAMDPELKQAYRLLLLAPGKLTEKGDCRSETLSPP